jgi:tetratricopeptide (TPR) repeat protein
MKTRTTILTIILIGLCFGMTMTAWTQESNSDKPRTIQGQAMNYFFKVREGDATAAGKAVTLLEEAVASAPNDASLWSLLGRAYFFRLSALAQTGGQPDPAALLSTLQKGIDAFNRALERDPNDSDALSGHGMALTILSGFRQDREAFARGAQEMNRAVELAPKSSSPRLARAFTSVNLPQQFRNTSAVIEDLGFLIQNAGGNRRAIDTMRILLGDVYAETGQAERAKSQYEAAAITSSLTRQDAQSRLAALQQGGVSAADIASLRAGLGSRCTMCHAQ